MSRHRGCATPDSECRAAAAHLKEDVWVESVTDGVFRGRILEETTVGGRSAIVPEITGSAHITGFHQFVMDPDDRLRHGFPAEWV